MAEIWHLHIEFEYDPDKSRTNAEKHGIDFMQAQALWNDPDRISLPGRNTGEPRRIVVGMIGDRLWSAVVTDREERTRLISVRRARDTEVRLYEQR